MNAERLTTFYKFLHRDPPDIKIPEHNLPHSLTYFTHLSHHQRLIPPMHNFNQLATIRKVFPHIDWNNLPDELIESTIYSI